MAPSLSPRSKLFDNLIPRSNAHRFRTPYLRIVSISLFLSIAFIFSLWSLQPVPVRRAALFNSTTIADRDVSREVYMTLLAPPDPHPWSEGHGDPYWETVTIMAHRLILHPETRDPSNRSFVVLATPNVKPKQIRLLEQLGAQVRIVPVLGPPPNVDPATVHPRWKDQYTKLLMWNMTEYTRIVYIDADALVVKRIDELFDLQPLTTSEGEEYLFASVYDSAPVKGFGTYPNRLPELGPDDKWGDNQFSAGQFVIMPSPQQSDYIFSLYNNPPWNVDFKTLMEQTFLRYAYRDRGPFPWMRLAQVYNTQWARKGDMAKSKIIHEKGWTGGPHEVEEIKEAWFEGWGNVQGYLAMKLGIGEYGSEPHPIARDD